MDAAHTGGPRHRRDAARGRRWIRIGARVIAAAAATAVLAATGVAWLGYHNVSVAITTSQALQGGPVSSGGDQNILIMGLDSRLDQHGQPLPQDMYQAMHAGDENAGGNNANVLIVLHVPGGSGPITAVSIPRDDYVQLSGCPTAECHGKIKQAYGLAYQRVMDGTATTSSSSGTRPTTTTPVDADDPTAREQSAREAGRKAEINAVRRLLGVPIDHFIELTMVAFFQIAQVVQPITVCLNGDSADPYSGADFHRGVQHIDAAEAMAFVRQRHDVNNDLFTDLDRTRRQQAFIASLVNALHHDGALSSPSRLHDLLDVAKQNVAVDAGFDLAAFVQRPAAQTGSPPSLYTLPIIEFGQDASGEDVNLIDVATIHSIVGNLFGTGSPTATPTTAPSTAGTTPVMLNVTNASRHNGAGTSLQRAFASRGFRAGAVMTADSVIDASRVEYGAGAHDAAQALARQLDLTATASDAVAANTVEVTIGEDFSAADDLNDTATTTSSGTAAAPVTTVAASTPTPLPHDLTRMDAVGVPCVR